jgi:hypothetical protein
MQKIYTFLIIFSISLFFVTGCKKTTGSPSATAQPTDFLQLQSGKYIIYRLDSTEFVNFGIQTVVVSYQAMDVIDSLITDNLGRPSWRVFRYLSDTLGIQPWVANETYFITPTKQDVEVVENNLRYIKLVYPVVNGYNWSGNSYIDVTTDTFNVLTYMQGWNYVYDSVGLPFNALGGIVPNSITVNQQNDTIGSVGDIASFSEIDYSEEVYGKGIGLIYKNFLHQEYQPPNGSTSVGSTSGYGIRLNMISHN